MGKDKTGLVLDINSNYRFIEIPEFKGIPPVYLQVGECVKLVLKRAEI